MLVHPAEWPVTQGDLNGPDAVHRQLVEWLAMLGLRTQTTPEDELSALDREIDSGEPVQVRDLSRVDGEAARLSRSRDG
jgi:hypothetical protein